jgi:peptidoglycan/LPS O-acetylase OafA/YrhL
MAAAPTNSAGRYAHIDALRALAVSIVVVGHAGVPMMPGDTGVTIFFVISGFIITHLLLRERERTGGFNIRRFYARRALKLAPPFLVLIIVPTLIFALTQPISWPAFGSQILFSYNWAQIWFPEAAWLVLPGSNVTWSLAVEEQFYIVWLLFVRRRWWLPALTGLACAAIVASGLIRMSLYFGGDNALHILRGTDTRMESIAWGILAAIAYKLWRDRPDRVWMQWLGQPWTIVLAMASFLASFAIPGEAFALTSRYTLHAIIVAVVILYGLVAKPDRLSQLIGRVSASKIITVVGLSSYSIYLAHDVLIHLLSGPMDALPFVLGNVTVIVIGFAVGIASYYLIERPALAYKNRRAEPHRAQPADVVRVGGS